MARTLRSNLFVLWAALSIAQVSSSRVMTGRQGTIKKGDSTQKPATAAKMHNEYPTCKAKLHSLGLELDDLLMSKDEVVSLVAAPSRQCGWWESKECLAEFAKQLAHDYFLRMTLVGQPDPRGPTLYTPPAQAAVLNTMKNLMNKMLTEGQKNPDLEFLGNVFQGIDIPDEGSWSAEIGNKFATVFNRGSGDTLYRSKDVTTKLYNLSTWGDDMANKIPEYNDLTYEDTDGTKMKALELRTYPLTSRTSFVYKYPPQGIEHELKKIIAAFVEGSSTMGEPSNMEVFETAEKWVRDFVILHPYTDSNGRTARVSWNILNMLNGLTPIVMAKQDENMTSSAAEFSDRICEGMVYAKDILRKLPGIIDNLQHPTEGSHARCCKAKHKLKKEEWCVSVPDSIECVEYGELTQSMTYLPWEEVACGEQHQLPGKCPEKVESVNGFWRFWRWLKGLR